MFQSQPQDPSPQNQRRRQMFLLALFALGVLVLGRTGLLDDAGFLGGGLGNTGAGAVRYQAIRDAEDLQRVIGRSGYDLRAVAEDGQVVPQLFVEHLPPGWAALQEAERRQLFVATLLPLVLSVNGQMSDIRDRLATVADAPDAGALSDTELALVRDSAAALGLPPDHADPVALARDLAGRVGPLPVALTLAQAGHDSDWGLAPARIGPAGGGSAGAAVTMPPAGPFAVPHPPPGRRAGTVDGPSLRAALTGQAMLLAVAPEAASFRAAREELEAAHAPLAGAALAAALAAAIPAAGAAPALQAIVEAQGLEAYDTARLDRPPALVLVVRPPGDSDTDAGQAAAPGASKQSEPSG